MGTLILIFVLSIAIIGGSVALGNFFMKKKFKGDTPGGIAGKNKITWDSGCPGLHNKTSKGVDLTERLVELGAPVLPDHCRYGFFPTLEIQNSNPQFAILSDTHTDCVAVVYKENGENPLIAFYRVNTLAKDREAEILAGAEQAHQKFMKAYGKHITRREFNKFIESGLTRPNAGLMRLGDTEREWVED